jgi:cytochrome P450
MSFTNDDNEGYSDQALRDVILNFIIAGRDTTGLTLSWFMYRLCLNPEVELKILEEIQNLEAEEGFSNVSQESGDHYTKFAELLSYRNLGKLQYLHAALTETLRLHPAIPMDGKTALADDVLPNGITVKKGTMVTYSAYCMGRLEKIWGPDAKTFRPERWLKNGVFQPESPFKFATFHAGPRACLGKDSAYLQMKLTAALLVKFFTFQLVPGHEVEYRTMFVLTMRRGIKVTATPRRSSSFMPLHATLHTTAVGV